MIIYRYQLKRMVEYGFLEGTDYIAISQKREKGLGVGLTDHQLTLDMTKKLVLLLKKFPGTF